MTPSNRNPQRLHTTPIGGITTHPDTRSRRVRLGIAIAWLVVLTIAAAMILASIAVSTGYTASKCHTVRECRQDIEWQKQARRRVEKRLAIRYRRDAYYAIRLASAAFHVNASDMRRIAWCESRMGAQVTAEAGSGASGLFQFLHSTWLSTPYASFDVFDPLPNALAAAQIVAHDGGWRQWSCSSITGVR